MAFDSRQHGAFFPACPIMTSSRILLAACLTLLLAACGDEHKDKAPSPTPPAQPTAETAPAPTPAPQPAAEQPRESEAVPAAAEPVASTRAPAVEAATKPEAKAPAKRETKADSRARTAKTPAVDPAVKQPLPPVKLDLRLPRDLVHQLQPDQPVLEQEDKPLLPPMFEEKTGQSPFEMGARLIQRERNERETDDDSWHSDIRGAELQFQFRN
ncbi:hypothetical protein ACAW63_23345 [Pseudomonas sp. QE6]|uniref:hypothetical protein n=1 Tax=Pseudomonas sp. QE6 TaxID=3242491 RepID=UPI003527B646